MCRRIYRRNPAPLRFLLIGLLLALGLPSAGPAYASESTADAIILVDIPDFTVNSKEGVDTVDLPGGGVLITEEGRPRVPSWNHIVDIPSGQAVRNVLLLERSGEESVGGLRLPVVALQDDPPVPPDLKPGWYPQEIYRWQVIAGPEGGSRLVITIYPFFHNPETGDSVFYRRYVFSVEKTIADCRIAGISLNREVCLVGGKVTVDLLLEGSSEARDAVLSLTVRQPATAENLSDIPLIRLPQLSGTVSCSAVWDTAGLTAGDYLLEAVLYSADGDRLDSVKIEAVLQNAGDIRPSATPSAQPTKPPSSKPSSQTLTVVGVIVAGLLILLAVGLLIGRNLLKKRKE